MKKRRTTFPPRILVPIDGSRCSLEAEYRAIEIKKKHSEIAVLHVIFIPLVRFIRFNQENLQTCCERCKWLNSLQRKAKAKDVKFRAVALKAKVSIVVPIVEFAAKNDIDLIILGTKGRTQFRKTPLGSVARRITAYAPGSVMVVR